MKEVKTVSHKIVSKRKLSENVFTAEIEASLIAQARKPGQFVIISINSEYSERIPLTIADADPEKGTIRLIWQRVGKTTAELADMKTGEKIANVVGPLGRPTHLKNFGTVACVGGGIGNAPLLPIAKALKKAGNKIISILGARSKDLLILEDEFTLISDELIVTTDDGSYGRKALVTEPLKELCQRDQKPNQAFVIGPAIMMKFCCGVTRQFNIPTQVSLNTIMVDATGMCGGCRVEIDGKPKFVCVDGPEFDGHKVNFDLMMKRLDAYKDQEQKAYEQYKKHKLDARCQILDTRKRSNEQRATSNENRESRKLLQQLLKKQKTGKLIPADRYKIPPQDMPAQDPGKRIGNVSEVATGYTETQARLEAMRCLQCKKAPCIKGCPVQIKIRDFIAAIADGDFKEAIDIIKEDSLLPAVCGRVCPQEVQCQQTCTVGLKFKDTNKAVSIGRLERFVADLGQNENGIPTVAPETEMKVAIIGSGPGGIVAAADTRRAGHDVTIFEAFHKPGGVMVYGIPEFRLPKAIVQKEIDVLTKMGVKIVCNFIVGRTRTVEQLMTEDGFNAVYIGVGAGLPSFMGIDGESLVGVYSANEYLTRANLMKAYDFGKGADTPIARSNKVAVVGGGNVAMDSARTALRLGAEKVYLVYRRTEKEMPARVEEVQHAKEEGIEFHILQSPKRIIGDQNSHVTAIECLKYRLGEPDESGRRRPIPIEGSEFRIDVDTVIIAIGNIANPLIRQTTPGLQFNKWGNIVVDENCKTSLQGVYAGGDIVLGAATVILAMGQGRVAAAAINQYLEKKPTPVS